MGKAEQSIKLLCDLTELKQVRDRAKRPVQFKPYYQTMLTENPRAHCREWPTEKAKAEIRMLVKASSNPHNILIYKDSSVARDWSGWRFTLKEGGRTVHEDSGACTVTISSLAGDGCRSS